jgi:hypothetical protein
MESGNPKRSPFGPDWRDAFGNTFEELVHFVITNIVNAEPEPLRYDPEVYPRAAINIAIGDLEQARGRPITRPVAATPEDLMRHEIAFLAAFQGADHPIMRANCDAARQRIAAIEARHPGTLAKIENALRLGKPALAGGAR